MSKVLLSKLRPIRDNIVVINMNFDARVTAGGIVYLVMMAKAKALDIVGVRFMRLDQSKLKLK
jgi:co-chaperonin GroES (HSP10)